MDLISSWSSLSTLKYTLRNFLDSLGLQHTEYGLEEGLSKLWAQDNLSIFCLNPVYGLDFKNQDPHACPGLEAVCLESDVRPHACGRLAKLGSQHLNAKEMRKKQLIIFKAHIIVVLGCLCKKINCTQKLRNQLSANPYILKCGPTSVSAPYKENKSKLSWNWYSMTLKIRQTVFQQQEKNRLPYWCFNRAMLFWGLGPGWVEGTGCVHQPTCKSENTC